MLANIRAAIATIIVALHNAWATLPIALQGALIVLLLALWTFVRGYGWYIPADPTNIGTWLAELSNAAVLAWVVVLPIIRDKIWPAIIPWVLTFFRLSAVSEARLRGMPRNKTLHHVTVWRAA